MQPGMKLVITVVDDNDSRPLIERLAQARVGATRLASTGGFLLEGNTTLMMAVESARLEEVLSLIRTTCVRRRRLIPQPVAELPSSVALPVEVEVGGAVIWILSLERVERL